MLRSILQLALDSVISQAARFGRFVYSFDGVDDRGQLAFRAINPDGDNTFEITMPETVTASNQSIISQSISSSVSSREFDLFVSTNGNLLLVRGGTQTTLFSTAQGVKVGTKYGITQTGDFFQIFEGGLNGPRVRTVTALSGTAREPSAQTVIGCRNNGSGGFANFFQGTLRDLKINGVLWPMMDRNQSIQLPEVDNLINLPFVRFSNASTGVLPNTVDAEGFSVATLTGAHAWGYIGFNFQALPGVTYLVETIADYVSSNLFYSAENNQAQGAVMVATFNNQPANQIVRQIATASADPVKTNMLVTRNFPAGFSGTVRARLVRASPLWQVEPVQRVINGDFASGTTGWHVTGGGSMAVDSGQATLTTVASQPSRFERGVALEANAYYEASCDLISLNGVTSARLSLIRDAAGNYRTTGIMSRSSPGKIVFVFQAPATDSIIQILGDSTNAGTIVVDNISIRKITSLCNPLTLVNTNPDRWSEQTV